MTEPTTTRTALEAQGVRTHHGIDRELCGTVRALGEQSAVVELTCGARMAADDRGLVHGGFTFGLADYAAMLAVNEPTVVLGKAEVRFLAPTVVGDVVVATATVRSSSGAKREVEVVCRRGDDVVFEGTFVCFVPEAHVLERKSTRDG